MFNLIQNIYRFLNMFIKKHSFILLIKIFIKKIFIVVFFNFYSFIFINI